MFVANLILILCVLGILVMFLRRIPEVVEENGQLQFAKPSAPEAEERTFSLKALLQNIGNSLARISSKIVNAIWRFMLEAKDHKQSQILASKFASLVRPRSKTMNIGAFNTIKKADRLLAEKQYDEAEQMYIQVIRKHPHEYSAYEGLLKIYFKEKKFDDVTEILEFLVSHNQNNDMYLAQLGNVYLSTRRFPEAASAYEKSIEINDLIPARYVNLGLALQSMGQHTVAKKNFQRAVDLDPSNMQYLMILVDNLAKLGEKDAAMAYLKAANERDPENVEVKNKLLDLGNS